MIDVLKHNRYLIEEQGAMFKSSFAMDVRDPESGDVWMQCREPPVRGLARLLRFSELKRTTPFNLPVYTVDGRLIMRIVRGVPLMSSNVRVLDAEDVLIGQFAQKVFSVTSAFDVLDAQGRSVCVLKGKPAGQEFSFSTRDGVVLARIIKKWAGMRKELFTAADHYLLEMDKSVPPENTVRQLVLASALCIGLVVKFELP